MANDNFYSQGQSQVKDAYNQGQSAINSFDPSAWSTQTQQGYNSLFGNQQSQQNDYIKAYQNAITSNPSMTSLYQTGNEAYNVPQLAQQANTLNNAVLTAPQTVYDSGKGFNMDNNQAQSQINMDLTRLSPLAQAANNQLQTAQGLAGGYVQAGLQQNQMNLLPVQQQGQMLNDLWARQASGFTTSAEGQLNGLINKMQSGVQLSTQEMQSYSQLAAAEEQYQATIAQTTAQQNIAQIGAQNQVLPTGSTYYNPLTGKAYNPFATPARP